MSEAVGDFLRPILEAGATHSWRSLIEQTTGRQLDGGAMAGYFEPLMVWLREENRGRPYSLPEAPP